MRTRMKKKIMGLVSSAINPNKKLRFFYNPQIHQTCRKKHSLKYCSNIKRHMQHENILFLFPNQEIFSNAFFMSWLFSKKKQEFSKFLNLEFPDLFYKDLEFFEIFRRGVFINRVIFLLRVSTNIHSRISQHEKLWNPKSLL
jgi:hypothetical protein